MKSKGFGDSVAKFTTATGIKYVVDKIADATNSDCGCDDRRDTLNRAFPIKNKTWHIKNYKQAKRGK
jgi:hypothetical protein